MVLLTTTPLIQSLLTSLPAESSLPFIKSQPDTISHDALIHLSRLTHTNLHTLLRGTRPYFPPPKVPPTPSPEYLALKARLLAQQEAREYAALLLSDRQKASTAVTGQGASAGADGNEDDEADNISISLPFNILISILCCGGAIFFLTRYWHNTGLRVLVSMGTALLVGVAEVVVYAAYLRKVREAKRKERRRREVKTVVVAEGNVVDDAKQAENIKRTGSATKEEIWGRGLNGGMRRRVREKWEKENEAG